MNDLFAPLAVGEVTVKNRIVMAPLTRMRSEQPGNIPGELNARYYAQRSGAGFIISEATQVSPQGQGYPHTPGIHSAEQVAGWKIVTDAVHQASGKIFLQLWHVGRISHSSFQPNGAPPVAPSAIRPKGSAFTADFNQVPFETPRELTVTEIQHIIADFTQAAKNAKAAGFDGAEVHGANGYLLDQFLQDGSNQRTDQYGGSIENRIRLLSEVTDAVIGVWGAGRVGVRLSPYGTFNDMSDSDQSSLFTAVFHNLNQKKLAYIHVIEPRSTDAGGGDDVAHGAPSTSELFRKKFDGVFISAGGYDPQSAKETVAAGHADAIAFGRYYISNPDLAERIKDNIPFARYDRSTFYGGGEKGYTDYPAAGAQQTVL